MRYAPLRSRKNSPAAPANRPGARSRSAALEADEQTVGDRFRAKLGAEYGTDWLARALGCSPETAAELDGYWIPQGPPHLLEQTIGVFAKVLELDAQRLFNLVHGMSSPQRASTPPPAAAQAPRSVAPRQSAGAEALSANPRRRTISAQTAKVAEISIGSADGVRVVKQHQPTIVYRKTRRFVTENN